MYKKHAGFCLETQIHPDAVNQEHFLNQITTTLKLCRLWQLFRLAAVQNVAAVQFVADVQTVAAVQTVAVVQTVQSVAELKYLNLGPTQRHN